MEDVHELMSKWTESQTKLEEKERDWEEKMEDQSIRSAQSQQTSLSSLIQDVAGVKNQFSNVSAAIQR